MAYPEAAEEPDADWSNTAAEIVANELVLVGLIGADREGEARGHISRELYYLMNTGLRPVRHPPRAEPV
jgi:hypothetical protein